MSEGPSSVELLVRCRAGDNDAAALLYSRFGQRMARLANRWMSRRLRTRVDPQEVVHSAFRTFFRRTTDGQFLLADSTSVWHLLSEITLNKVRRQGAYHRAGKRCVDREAGESETQEAGEPADRKSSPSDWLAALDLILTAKKQLPDNVQEFAELSMAGYSPTEISRITGVVRSTVHRGLNRFRANVKRLSVAAEEK
jgi:RNA polymerase sigma-70 factor (ECF subfamily)